MMKCLIIIKYQNSNLKKLTSLLSITFRMSFLDFAFSDPIVWQLYLIVRTLERRKFSIIIGCFIVLDYI